ncbi:TPA: hypothetical protein ACH3X1_001662 [Trebouxia sp. C0004]
MTMPHRMMSVPDVQKSFQSSLAELSDYRQRDKDAFWSDTRAICRLDAVMEQIETIIRARADQRLKDIQSALATASSAPKKQMFARLVHLRQSFPDGTSFERANEIANRIRKIGKVAKEVWRITKLDKNSTHIIFHDNQCFSQKVTTVNRKPNRTVIECCRKP